MTRVLSNNVQFHYHMDREGVWVPTKSHKRVDCQYGFIRVITHNNYEYVMVLEIRPDKFKANQIYLITEED